jgi:hypothetical protein
MHSITHVPPGQPPVQTAGQPPGAGSSWPHARGVSPVVLSSAVVLSAVVVPSTAVVVTSPVLVDPVVESLPVEVELVEVDVVVSPVVSVSPEPPPNTLGLQAVRPSKAIASVRTRQA